MTKEISKEEFLKLYKGLHPKIQNMLFDEEVGLTLTKICKRHMVESKYQEIMDLIVDVLIGLLPPQDIEKILIRDLDVPITKAKEIALEINRFIFFPIKEEISDLYGIKSKEVFKDEESSSSGLRDTYREEL
ncbi:MAG: hypothetical protein PHV25_00500 [Candidatus Pacebacteria bacterium]|nr:hypothetical protein [Candidatus Paceibacterota bacterium]